MQTRNSRQAGFTLVEIAIVLVIIGLLLGGILKGQEMIVQAKIKNAMAEISGVGAAYYGYRDRYRAIPGDDPQAASRWTTPTAAAAGNNDGIVAGAYNLGCTTVADIATESCAWWDHLRRSGFIAGAGTQQPINAFNGKIGVQTGNAASPPATALATAAGGLGLTGIIICSGNLLDKVAIAFDAQVDDGTPNTGQVRAQLNSSGTPNPDIAAVAAAAYQETGLNFYTSCRAL